MLQPGHRRVLDQAAFQTSALAARCCAQTRFTWLTLTPASRAVSAMLHPPPLRAMICSCTLAFGLMHRNFKMPVHQADAMTEASCLHSDA